MTEGVEVPRERVLKYHERGVGLPWEGIRVLPDVPARRSRAGGTDHGSCGKGSVCGLKCAREGEG